MVFNKTTDYKAMCRKAANIISAEIIVNPTCVLGLATGSTPLGVYTQLIDWYCKGDLDFSGVKTINLDEYKGIPSSHPQSYRHYMYEHLFSRINIRLENIHIPNGLAEEDEAECLRYNEIIRKLGGIDLQLLGIGHNGHIGFNEPGRAFEQDTHLVSLTNSTIESNARFFASKDEVPRQAYTVGIKSIMQARKIVVIVSGDSKAEITKAAFLGPITPDVPASILQMHPNITLVGDSAALQYFSC